LGREPDRVKRTLPRTLRSLRARPRLATSLAIGVAIALLLPGNYHWVTRGLLGWNAAVWLYLILIGLMIARSDHERVRRVALAQAEGAATVLALVAAAAVASLFGIVFELSAAKLPGATHAVPHAALALSTVAGGWTLLPVLFTLAYASAYHAGSPGLRFPDSDTGFRPRYGDFLYFAFTIAVASQTADVSVTSAPMRRLVLLQALLSFLFNTAILAFTVNIAASMF
jgi:uncharacterized membrane protein